MITEHAPERGPRKINPFTQRESEYWRIRGPERPGAPRPELARVGDGGSIVPDECDANAALMIAAPRLLNAARDCLSSFGGDIPDGLEAEADALEAASAAKNRR